MPDTPEPVESRFTFRIRDLFPLIAWVAVIGGWFIDRYFLSQEISRLVQENRQGEILQDPFERKIMNGSMEGMNLSEFPEIPMLADHVVTRKSENFDRLHSWLIYPDKRDPPENCRIYYFDLMSSGEGDPFDFYLMTHGDQIIQITRGESLNS